MINEDPVRVQCAWCQKVMREGLGEGTTLVSHGCCSTCLEKLLKEIEENKKGKS